MMGPFQQYLSQQGGGPPGAQPGGMPPQMGGAMPPGPHMMPGGQPMGGGPMDQMMGGQMGGPQGQIDPKLLLAILTMLLQKSQGGADPLAALGGGAPGGAPGGMPNPNPMPMGGGGASGSPY